MSWIASLAQSSKEDSTRIYGLAIWQAWELVQIAKEQAACDSLQKKQAADYAKAMKAIAAQDSLSRYRSIQIATLTGDSKNWEDRFHNQEAQTTIQSKKKGKWMLITAIIVALEVIARFVP